MASFNSLLQNTNSRFESPARVFARLKSKVQREAMCAKNQPSNVGNKQGADFKSPRKRTENFWMNDELDQNERFDSYRNNVQALTISPIPTPRKRVYAFSDVTDQPVEETEHVFMARNGHTPVKRTFLESTAVNYSPPELHRQRVHTEPIQMRPDVLTVTPIKKQQKESDSVFEDHARVNNPMSPVNVFSLTRKSLSKARWEQQQQQQQQQQQFTRVSSSTKKVRGEVISQPQGKKTSDAFSEDNTHNKSSMEDLSDVTEFPAEQPEMRRLIHEPMFPAPKTTTWKRCYVLLDTLPTMSPAKMFSYLKQRESKQEQQNAHEVSSSTRKLFDDGNNLNQTRDMPLATAHSMPEEEDSATRSATDSVVPVNHSIIVSADSRSDSCEDVWIPAAPTQPVLLEDPLVLNSPQISIPKTQMGAFKRKKWPHQVQFPNESVIHLKDWFLRKNRNGLFVDGINRNNNIPWHSNVIVDRVSNSKLKTVSGRVYILVGKMNLSIDTGFPQWLLMKFVNGFPPNWKALYDKFLSESRHNDKSRETEMTSERRTIVAKTKPEKGSTIKPPVRQRRQKPFKPPEPLPPAIPSSTKVSRSGRTIKPPLEYWKGGRVILDAEMNVTIHEGYDTSICVPEVAATVSARKSQKSARVALSCSDDDKQHESVSGEEVSAIRRRVKPPLRKGKRTDVIYNESTSNSPKTPVETISSPEEWSCRPARSSRRCRPMDTQRQKKPEKTSPESQSDDDQTLQQQLPEEESSTKKKQEGKGVYKKQGKKAPKSRSSRTSSSSPESQSSENSGMELRESTRVRKNTDKAQKLTKNELRRLSTKMTLPKKTKSSKTHKKNKGSTFFSQQQDEDEWSEAELKMLQQAVSYYPKHMTGYWAKVSQMVGTRSAEECHKQFTFQGTSRTPARKDKKPRKMMEAPKDPVTDHPVISAHVGTFKRKQQVRQFLETMPRDNVDDVFSSAYMQNKRFEIPSMCMSEDNDFAMSDTLEPLTPKSQVFPEVKTPQCLHITPGMMGSPSRNNDDKYVYQLQKRMKKNQFNVCKQAHPVKSFTPTPSVKRTMRRRSNTENDTFVVWEMFPGNDAALSESGEEEDFYFSDND